MYRLQFQDRAAPKEPLVVDLPSLVIGHRADCQIQLAEPGVSDRHATIERRPDGYYVRSVDSSSLVYVNGAVVTERRLASGDELEIGPAHIRFEIVHGATSARERRPIDLLQVLATAIIVAVIAGQISLLCFMFSENRPQRVKLDAARRAQPDQAGSAFVGPSLSGGPVSDGSQGGGTVESAQPPAEPAVLNHMIRITRVDRSESGDAVSITIQAKAQVGERELDASAVAICVQFAAVDGAGPGIEWRRPVWLRLPAWENFSTKVFTVRFPGATRELIGFVVRSYYRRQMQDIYVVPASLRSLAPNPLAGGLS